VMAQGEDIIPLTGARWRNQLSEALAALEVILALEDLVQIERAAPKGAAAGERYPAAQMSLRSSERTHRA